VLVSHLVRDAAANRAGSLSKIGMGTFVDPRQGGGKLNQRTTVDAVKLVEVEGEQYLFYKAPRIKVALLRGTTSDTDGNVSLEREAFFSDVLNMASPYSAKLHANHPNRHREDEKASLCNITLLGRRSPFNLFSAAYACALQFKVN
jgi:acyl CoA:acetate/3-ketoacid CoA transferase